jgi:hypothetical protein
MVNTPGRSINEKTAKTSGGSLVFHDFVDASTVYGSNHRGHSARLVVPILYWNVPDVDGIYLK